MSNSNPRFFNFHRGYDEEKKEFFGGCEREEFFAQLEQKKKITRPKVYKAAIFNIYSCIMIVYFQKKYNRLERESHRTIVITH